MKVRRLRYKPHQHLDGDAHPDLDDDASYWVRAREVFIGVGIELCGREFTFYYKTERNTLDGTPELERVDSDA